MALLKKKPFAKAKEAEEAPAEAAEQYIDLSEMVFEDEGGEEGGPSAAMMVRVGELFRYEDLAPLTQQVYSGNLVIIDYTSIANDDLTLKRITAELRNVARDVNGDVAGVAKNLLMVTPQGVRIDRNKIKGGV